MLSSYEWTCQSIRPPGSISPTPNPVWTAPAPSSTTVHRRYPSTWPSSAGGTPQDASATVRTRWLGLTAAPGPQSSVHRGADALGDRRRRRDREVLERVRGRQRDVGRRDPHDRAVEIEEAIFGDDG